MRTTIIDEDGNVRCPMCGAINSFTVKRTGKAKVAGAAAGGVGILAMPKRLQCNGCGTNLKTDRAAAVQRENQSLRAKRKELRKSGLSLWATQREMHRTRDEQR